MEGLYVLYHQHNGKLMEQHGISSTFTWQQGVMIGISLLLLLFLAIGKKFEPFLLLPIAFGMLLVNLPLTGLDTRRRFVLLSLWRQYQHLSLFNFSWNWRYDRF